MTTRDFKVRALGEIAIRCRDKPAMIAFFRVADGFAGHIVVLALFPHDLAGAVSSLHHLAFSLPRDEQEAVIAWYGHLGRAHSVRHFDRIGWRGVFTTEPDGKTVELVARDPGWRRSEG